MHDDPDLTRQDEDIAPAEFAAEEVADHPDFGWWPEALGLAMTAAICWMIFAFTG
jgi:hypothetical protein